MHQTDFQKIIEFNKAFGVKTNTTPQLNILENDPKLIAYRLALVQEEFEELQEAITTNNFTEIIDALTDIQYVVLGFYTAIGIDADKAFKIVHDSNMSKLCKTEEDAIETVKRYKEETPQRYDSPNYRKSDDGIHWVVYNESTTKILKSYLYTPANFESLISPKTF